MAGRKAGAEFNSEAAPRREAEGKPNEEKNADEHGAQWQQQEPIKKFFDPEKCSGETADHVAWQKGRLNLQNGDYLLYLTLVRNFVKSEMDILEARSDAAKRQPVAEPRPAVVVDEPLAASA